MDPRKPIFRLAALAMLAWSLPSAGEKAEAISKAASEPKRDQTLVAPPKPATAEPDKSGTAFAELKFNRTLVIEGRVEKPQVTFTLLKEPPPTKEIRFEASFMENILKLDRENTFVPGETYGRD